MRKKTYKRLTLWITILSLAIALIALNPTKVKRIACKVAVFLEFYKNLDECQFGCGSRKKPRPSSDDKKQKGKENKLANKKLKGASIKRCSLSSGAHSTFLSFGLGHLLVFTCLKLAAIILNRFLLKKITI